MDEKLETIPSESQQYILDLFSNVITETGSPVNVSPLFDRFAPALFDCFSLTDLTTSTPNDKKAGYLAFYQSLSAYTINHYGTLSTTFLEHILSQTTAILPITKIATILGLDENQFDSCYETNDRLLILLGVLKSHYGSSAIDSFMFPLFEKHIFNDIQFPQPDHIQDATQFEGLIRTRGVMNIYYQQLDVTCPQSQRRWECTITYRLGTNTPFLLHHRLGKNKKQAKLRTLHDIYTYYTRSQIEFFLPNNNWNPDHPHCQPHTNFNTRNTISLSIPIEHMHEYDDDQYENVTLVDRQRLNESNPNYVHIPADHSDSDAEYIDHLTQVLLGDNNNNDDDDSPQASPLPAATEKQQQDDQRPMMSSVPSSPLQSKVNAVLSSPLPSKTNSMSLSSSPSLSSVPSASTPSKSEIVPATNREPSPGDQQATATTPTTTTTPLSSATPENATAPEKVALLANEEVLMDKAKILMDQLTVMERCRFNDYQENLQRNPYDAKGCLLNIARKMDGVRYHCTSQHVQLGKAGTRAHYIATVRFGSRQVEVLIARGHTKKSSAEALAAVAIFDLLQKASKSINTAMKLPFLD